jgi:hypothetical protein
MAVIRRPKKIPDLKAETIAILLGGWGAHPPADEPKGPHGFCGGQLALFTDGDSGIARTWRVHEQFLRATAARWGWTPDVRGTDGRSRFWAEDVADRIAR